MKHVVLLSALLFLAGSMCSAQAGNRTITGQVRAAEDRHPVEGATVQVKGTKNVSGSQEDGIYYISVRPSDSILVVSHPDYEAREIRLTRETEYNVELKKRNGL